MDEMLWGSGLSVEREEEKLAQPKEPRPREGLAGAPWSLSSRTVSQMPARLDRFNVCLSSRRREEVPTLMTCGRWH